MSGMLSFLLLGLAMVESGLSLVVEDVSAGGGVVYPHSTALFGPQVPDYNVKGKIHVVTPPDLCTQPKIRVPDGSIVLAKRGNCTFSAKGTHASYSQSTCGSPCPLYITLMCIAFFIFLCAAFFAQSMGADGLIVGDNKAESVLVRMKVRAFRSSVFL